MIIALHGRPRVLLTRTAFNLSVGLLFGVLLFAVLTNQGNGELALTPSSIAPICPGDQLHLTCNSSSSPVVWTVYDTNNGMNHSRSGGATPSAGITTASPLHVGSFTFNIASQIVDNNGSSSHSLISNITVDNVNITLNATVIICTEFATGIQDMVTVNIRYNLNGFQLDKSLILSLLVNNTMFGINNVTASLEFDKTMAFINSAVSVSYNINATSDHSDAVEVEFHEASVSITFPYNTPVDVYVEAVACGQSTAATITIQFNFTQLLNPIVEDEDNITISSCRDMESVDRAHSTTLICYSEQHLYQQDVCVITCASGNLWEPNILETDFIACSQRSDNIKELNCTCGKCPLTTTLTIVYCVATFVLSSLLCSICCGLLNCVVWRRISTRSKAASNLDTGPIYDDIASTTAEHNTKLELKDNKAYAQIAAKQH